jgi:transcription initiation factor TFIIIB Brf1 subunit/transcription initiation factor TFIIB
MRITGKFYPEITKKERSESTLTARLSEILVLLNIHDSGNNIKDIVVYTMGIVKKHCGQKRSMLKDAIIILCIAKVKMSNPLELAKSLDIHKKYVYKAEKLLIELKVTSPSHYIESPIEYITRIYAYTGDSVTLDTVIKLIRLCETYDIMSQSSNTTIAISCLYYVLVKQGYTIDIGRFVEKYSISRVNVQRMFKTLETHFERLFV